MDDWSFALGFIISDLKFHASMTRSTQTPTGFRLRKYIWWRTLFAKPRDELLELVEEQLETVGISLKEEYHNKKEIQMWFSLIEKANLENKLSDQLGIEQLKFVLDNPFPKTFDNIVKWAEEFDNIELGYLKETINGVEAHGME